MIHGQTGHRLPRLLEYDVCIIGSGPAGLTVAAELATTGSKICVLESGVLKPTYLGDSLRKVISEGIVIKDYSRERVFGGTSTTWAGLSSPMDAIDFEARPYLKYSGWPIQHTELLHYYRLAADNYGFPSLSQYGPDGFGGLRSTSSLQPSWSGIEEKIFLASVSSQNFAVHLKKIFESSNTDLFLDATAIRLEGSKPAEAVDRALVRSSGGQEFRVHARIFVIATGAIENARLLLNSQDLCERGLGNEHDMVGRFLMNHPKNYHGILKLKKTVTDLPYFFGCIVNKYSGYAGIRLTDSVQRNLEVLNSYIRFEPLFSWTDSKGVESLVTIAKTTRFFFNRFSKKGMHRVVSLRDYSETGDDSELQNTRKTMASWFGLGLAIVADSPLVAQYLYHRFFNGSNLKVSAIRLRNFMEMEPQPENRVILSGERDAYDQPLPCARHVCSQVDRRSLIELHRIFKSECRRCDIGELHTSLGACEPWPINQDASHHMGTTRMGKDAENSVVDTNCRLHTVKNVYLAGSSVFPTSGCANPTFTIVALSIRLGQHLQNILKGRSSGQF